MGPSRGRYSRHPSARVAGVVLSTPTCPAGMLDGDGKRMRHVKLRHGESPDTEALAELFAIARRDLRPGLAPSERPRIG